VATFVPNQNLTAALLNALFDKIMNDPATTALSGTTFAGTETLDAVLGNYVFTASAGRRYRVTYSGILVGSSVANDNYAIRIRDGGASTPTAASTLIAASQGTVVVAGGTGFAGCPVSGTFTPSAGTRTLAAFGIRIAGSGTLTPAGTRELYVEDIGAA